MKIFISYIINNNNNFMNHVRDNLETNITIHKSIKNMFMKYSVSYVLQTIRKNTKSLIQDKKIKRIILKIIYQTKSYLFIKEFFVFALFEKLLKLQYSLINNVS